MKESDLEATVRGLITKSCHLSLATCIHDKPWMCELHFAYNDDLNLYFLSRRTTRHCQEIVVNPFVSGSIIPQHQVADEPVGLYFEGSAVEITSPSDSEIKTYSSALSRSQENVKDLLKDSGRGMYKVSVTMWYIFGRFGDNPTQKYELVWQNEDEIHE